MAWFNDVSELVDALFVGSHIGPGGVPRGTEVQTLSCENVEECTRSLHIMHGYLTAVLRYNKTRHNMQMDKLIARFFPPRLGRLFLYYLVIIRPLEKMWADDVFGPGKSFDYRHLVFVRFAKPMRSPHFSKVLYDSSLHHINIGLGIHDYRQFVKAVLRIVLNIDYDNGEEDTIDVADASFGHSRETGTAYGVSYDDLPGLTSELLRAHQGYCERVHRWLGEGKHLPKHVNPLSATQMATTFNKMHSLIDESLERNPSQETIVKAIKDTVTDVVNAEVQQRLTPAIQVAVASEISYTLSNMPWQYLIGTDTKVPEDCHSPVVVEPSTLRSLRRLLGDGATPKSPEQAKLLQLVLDRKFHVVGILPTGGGKSILYQVPAVCDKSGITVCIFPFRALTQDQVIQANDLNIPVATWPERRSRSIDDGSIYQGYLPIDPDQTTLVCVSAHDAGDEGFLPWLRALFNNGLLKRVVVDEAHELLMSDYRACMANIQKIQQLAVPIICLSATLTSSAIPSLIKFFGFPSSTVRIVRADTPRPSIAYHTVRVTENELFSAIAQEIEQFPLKKDERGLVFCNTYQDCETLNAITGIPVYYGRLDELEKDKHAGMWRSGEVQRLICTSGFGNGVNNPHCRHVVHCRDPKTMCRYVQETGRAGRDGGKARAVLFYTEVPGTSNIEAPDAAGQLAMHQYLSQTDQCKRVVISRWSDGKERVQSCSSIPAAELCGWCSVRFFKLLSLRQSHCYARLWIIGMPRR
jgi:superfamily II DNA helicase RecQ